MGLGMFDGIVEGLILAGVVIGVVCCGIGAFLLWVFMHLHISIGWV